MRLETDEGHAVSNRGTGPIATLVSPASSAKATGIKTEPSSSARVPPPPTPIRLAQDDVREESMGPIEETDDEAFEIELEFRRKVAGLRRLPKRERAAALRAAREWYALALQALRERKAGKRHAHYLAWRAQLPTAKQGS